jgi:hypothetical protein
MEVGEDDPTGDDAYKERGGPKRADQKVVRLRIPFLGSVFLLFSDIILGRSDMGFHVHVKASEKYRPGVGGYIISWEKWKSCLEASNSESLT